MKKITFILFVAIISLSLSQIASAQISVGGGLAYGTNIEEIGIQVGGTYVLNEEMRVGGDFIYWLTESNEFADVTFFEINANFNYIFFEEEDLVIYAIGTLGLHRASVDSNVDLGGFGGFDVSSSETELGLGVGAGLEYDLGSVLLYVEPRLFLSGFDQLSLAAGARIPINN